MGRKVKCQITKEFGDSSEFYKAPNGKYYKTEELYNQWKRQSDDRKECISLLCEYGNYKNGDYAPTLLNKIVSEIGQKMGYDILLETIRDCDAEFIWANENKNFDSEIGRLFYYKAIIRNKIVDVYKKHEHLKQQQVQMDATPIDAFVDVDNIGCPTGKGKDLTELLGEI